MVGALSPDGGILIDQKVLDAFPGLDTYLDMLNKAIRLDDHELIDYISGKVSRLFGKTAILQSAAAT